MKVNKNQGAVVRRISDRPFSCYFICSMSTWYLLAPHHIHLKILEKPSVHQPYTNQSITYEAFFLILFVHCVLFYSKKVSYLRLNSSKTITFPWKIDMSMWHISLGVIWYLTHTHHRVTNNVFIFHDRKLFDLVWSCWVAQFGLFFQGFYASLHVYIKDINS